MSTLTRLPVSRVGEAVAVALGTAHEWGYVELLPPGWGAPPIRRITVFSPDISRSERRALALAQHWPVAGAILTLFVMIALGALFQPITGALIAFGLYAASVAGVLRRARHARHKTARADDLAADGPEVLVIERRLVSLETAARRGLISRERYRSEWDSLFRALQ
jgi:hypothetical protein